LLRAQDYPRLGFLAQLALAAVPAFAWWQAFKRGWPPATVAAYWLNHPFSRATRKHLWFLAVLAVACLFLTWRELRMDPALAKLARLQAANIPFWAAGALQQHRGVGLLWLLAALLGQGVLMPWFEELFFRGFLFSALKVKVRSLLAWLLSGLFYCAFQAALWILVFDGWDPRECKRYLFGFLLFHAIGCRLLARSQSLAPSIVFHTLWNLGRLLFQIAGLFL
jgi:membrane protease YdiL (CAAX protease family)